MKKESRRLPNSDREASSVKANNNPLQPRSFASPQSPETASPTSNQFGLANISLQPKLSTTQKNPIQQKENNTGLPNNLKSGIENLSGYSLDDVKVHYNSDKPKQLQAHAYAQGTDIHVAAGQEKHLPHEAWHVVQQKQGRVKPTKKLNGNVNVNDDQGLETEADTMGAKAATWKDTSNTDVTQNKPKATGSVSEITQRKSVQGVSNYGNFADLGNGLFGTTQPTNATEVSGLVNEIRLKAAEAGIHQNVKVITGTHGDTTGHLIGEAQFYTEDLAHEGHKVAEGGWINVLNVKGKSKETIANWMAPGASAIILA
ncbi:MAG: DUF4157 domain-containing protein, partial [Cyanobacteria bacterium P01_C01_bin.69]